jgi:hypothetical protein
MMFRECDIGNGLRPGRPYTLLVYVEGEGIVIGSESSGTMSSLNFEVPATPSNYLIGGIELTLGWGNATYVNFTPVLKGFAWGVVIRRGLDTVGTIEEVKAGTGAVCHFANVSVAARTLEAVHFTHFCDLIEGIPLNAYVYKGDDEDWQLL